MQLHDGCPIVEQELKPKPEAHEEPYRNGLFMQVAQGLSSQFVKQVRGTKGLTDERIEQIRHDEISDWGNLGEPGGEADYLAANPGLAKAVHDCELMIQMGECLLQGLKRGS